MFAKSENALADYTALNIRYSKYYLEQIATTASQIVPTIVWCTKQYAIWIIFPKNEIRRHQSHDYLSHVFKDNSYYFEKGRHFV